MLSHIATKLKTPAFVLGLLLLVLTVFSFSANMQARTLDRPGNAGALLLLAAAAAGLVIYGRVTDGTTLTNPVLKLLDQFGDGFYDMLQEAGGRVQERLKKRDARGRFAPPVAEQQDTQALYQLASQAATLQGAQRKTMLKLCRELNDVLFTLHHDPTTEGSPDGTKPAHPNVKPPVA